MVKFKDLPPNTVINNYKRACPHCGVPCDCATMMHNGDPGRGTPELRDGDVSICNYCGEISMFKKSDNGRFHLEKFDIETLPEGESKWALQRAMMHWKATRKKDDELIKRLKEKYPSEE